MAQGDLTIFNEAKTAVLNAVHDFDSDTFKVAFITSIPVVAQTTPTLGDYTECTAGGNYPSGGFTMTAAALAESGGTVTVDFTSNISMVKHASNPTNIFAALIYNSSKSNQAVGWVEIETAGADGSSGLISVTWGANLFTLA